MRKLKYIEKYFPVLRETIIKNSPNGYEATNIRVEHYSNKNENRIIIDNVYYKDSEMFPFSATIGKNLETNIVFHGIKDNKRKNLIKQYDMRNNLADIYNSWINTDEKILEILINILTR